MTPINKSREIQGYWDFEQFNSKNFDDAQNFKPPEYII